MQGRSPCAYCLQPHGVTAPWYAPSEKGILQWDFILWQLLVTGLESSSTTQAKGNTYARQIRPLQPFQDTGKVSVGRGRPQPAGLRPREHPLQPGHAFSARPGRPPGDPATPCCTSLSPARPFQVLSPCGPIWGFPIGAPILSYILEVPLGWGFFCPGPPPQPTVLPACCVW